MRWDPLRGRGTRRAGRTRHLVRREAPIAPADPFVSLDGVEGVVPLALPREREQAVDLGRHAAGGPDVWRHATRGPRSLLLGRGPNVGVWGALARLAGRRRLLWRSRDCRDPRRAGGAVAAARLSSCLTFRVRVGGGRPPVAPSARLPCHPRPARGLSLLRFFSRESLPPDPRPSMEEISSAATPLPGDRCDSPGPSARGRPCPPPRRHLQRHSGSF